MLIKREYDNFSKNKYTLQLDNFKFKCCIGKRVLLILKKKEIKNSKGTFNIENLYFRKDRIEKPRTKLKCIGIKSTMGWCDDVLLPKKYNKLIKINKKIKHEKLMRKDNKYDLLIPIKYNFKKPIVGKGSCIFIHLTKNYKFTEGCIAMKKRFFNYA